MPPPTPFGTKRAIRATRIQDQVTSPKRLRPAAPAPPHPKAYISTSPPESFEPTSPTDTNHDSIEATPPTETVNATSPAHAYILPTSPQGPTANATPPPHAYILPTSPQGPTVNAIPPPQAHTSTSPGSTVTSDRNRPTPSLVPRPPDFTKVHATPDGHTDYTRLHHMVEALQMALRRIKLPVVRTDWSRRPYATSSRAGPLGWH
jgi:hypothetical protein